MGSLPFFSQNLLPRQRPLRYRKKGPDRSSAPADPEIICLREILKKIFLKKKRKKLMQAKYIARSAS